MPFVLQGPNLQNLQNYRFRAFGEQRTAFHHIFLFESLAVLLTSCSLLLLPVISIELQQIVSNPDSCCGKQVHMECNTIFDGVACSAT
jgi:hypothetical protein